MLPSLWLSSNNITGKTLYREATLEKLRFCEIGYVDGMLTSHMMWGLYPTYGRLASVRLLTPREAVAEYGAKFSGDTDGRFVLGCDIAAAIWGLVHPILEDGPPSMWVEDLEAKFQRDLAAIRRYGY